MLRLMVATWSLIVAAVLAVWSLVTPPPTLDGRGIAATGLGALGVLLLAQVVHEAGTSPCAPCEGSGVVRCWSPGGPCETDGCELCGSCMACGGRGVVRTGR